MNKFYYIQLTELHREIDKLHLVHGATYLKPVYGAGCINNPEIMLIFMNPTGKNVSANPDWPGVRAPWLGIKNIWKMFEELGFICKQTGDQIQILKANDWTPDFAEKVYTELADNHIFVTNLAKCTQIDARPLHNNIFKDYLYAIYHEILVANPKKIISFGNQVSSILLGKNIAVGNYLATKSEMLDVSGRYFKVYPTFYPVGQGQRNLPFAIRRIKAILK